MSDLQPLAVLDFWFGKDRDPAGPLVPENGFARWFQKDADFDEEIRAQFGPYIVRAIAGSFDDWQATPEGTLALVVLIDQFSRNLNRGKPESFIGDAKAREVVAHALEKGTDSLLRPIERMFFYLPFEHAEDLGLQNRCVELMETVASSLEGDQVGALAGSVEYAYAHQKVIAEFGRFPHRNEALGRESTPAELEYLSKPGAGF